MKKLGALIFFCFTVAPHLFFILLWSMEKLLGLSELSIISWRLMLRIAIKWSFSVCVNFNSLHAKCTFICIRDLFSLRKVHTQAY